MANSLNKNQEILLTIKRIGINGEGIGYYRRLAVFVPGVLPQEEVVVRITEVYEQYAKGVMVKIKGEQSPERVQPLCPSFGTCGGCTMQHIKYETQLRYKKNIVMESFLKYYDKELNPKIFKDTVGMEKPYFYRNKVKKPVRYDGEKLVTGLYAFDTNRLVYIDKCIVEKEDLQECVTQICAFLTKHQVIAYNPKLRDGVLRHIIARSSQYSGEIQVTLVLYKKDIRMEKIAKELMKIDKVVSVYISINDDLDSLEGFGKTNYLLAGKEVITEKLGSFTFNLLPQAFFQLNHYQTEKLYDEVYRLIKPERHFKIVDCYCGVGTIALWVSDKATKVVGIDNNLQAIENAIENAKINNVNNVEFMAGSVLESLVELKKKGFIPDVLIVDPPRLGMELSLIRFIQENPIKNIIYVSCNPAMLAKNCNHLASKYAILSIKCFDMFPQTANVETIVLLERK